MIEHGTGGAAYYADVLEEVVRLAVTAPCGPPASAADFLARLDPGWLRLAYAASPDAAPAALLAARQVADVALRFRTLLRRLGDGLDGPGGFGDADAWYCILEGTAEITVAEAQARALVDLLAWYAASPGGPRREVLLAVDEFSAVSRRLPIWQLYERARSLGLAVQVSAQSWQGLAADEDERYRVASTADGGIWLLRTPYPEPVTALAGHPAGGGHHAPPARRAAVGARGTVPGRGHAGGGRRADPRPGRRPGGLHLPGRRQLCAGQAAGGRAGPAGRARGPGGGPGRGWLAARTSPASPARRRWPMSARCWTRRSAGSRDDH